MKRYQLLIHPKNTDRYHKHVEWKKQIHSYEVQELAKLIYVDRNQASGCLRGRGLNSKDIEEVSGMIIEMMIIQVFILSELTELYHQDTGIL